MRRSPCIFGRVRDPTAPATINHRPRGILLGEAHSPLPLQHRENPRQNLREDTRDGDTFGCLPSAVVTSMYSSKRIPLPGWIMGEVQASQCKQRDVVGLGCSRVQPSRAVLICVEHRLCSFLSSPILSPCPRAAAQQAHMCYPKLAGGSLAPEGAVDQASMQAVENSAGRKPHVLCARQPGCLQPSKTWRG